ncbi:dienelactone hydrolase family protein [Stenotrophomonas tumulicola]|uniref:Dienelactone hydrolase family protein n=1 Tax=Stenotrophomonas tumulicola TaxID=1685415 RepID=A0A7W3FNF8_9GAMM|nr:dienelactone hydrolase family protein [Stenotrophomonas tumulicola]MBA8682739.1 dienelactone hydrolase family protein [Stenotrophomonas tumulicola]
MSHWITLVTRQGRINAWEAAPDDKPNGGVVLLHDIFGINNDVVRIASRYSDAGYLTIIPSLFDSLQRNVEMDYTAENEQRGRTLAAQLPPALALDLIASAADAIAHAGRLAIVGHGWGGSLALRAWRQLNLPCVSYYGQGGLPPQASGHEGVPAILHQVTNDPHFTGHSAALQESSQNPAVYRYATGTNFDRPAGHPHHHAQSADIASRRTLEFLRTQIHQRHD